MTFSHNSTVASSLPSYYPPVHLPIIPSTLADMQYNYTLELYVEYGSAKEWLT